MPYLVKRKKLMLMLLISLDTQCKALHVAYSPPNSTQQRNNSKPFQFPRSILTEK